MSGLRYFAAISWAWGPMRISLACPRCRRLMFGGPANPDVVGGVDVPDLHLADFPRPCAVKSCRRIMSATIGDTMGRIASM